MSVVLVAEDTTIQTKPIQNEVRHPIFIQKVRHSTMAGYQNSVEIQPAKVSRFKSDRHYLVSGGGIVRLTRSKRIKSPNAKSDELKAHSQIYSAKLLSFISQSSKAKTFFESDTKTDTTIKIVSLKIKSKSATEKDMFVTVLSIKDDSHKRFKILIGQILGVRYITFSGKVIQLPFKTSNLKTKIEKQHKAKYTFRSRDDQFKRTGLKAGIEERGLTRARRVKVTSHTIRKHSVAQIRIFRAHAITKAILEVHWRVLTIAIRGAIVNNSKLKPKRLNRVERVAGVKHSFSGPHKIGYIRSHALREHSTEHQLSWRVLNTAGTVTDSKKHHSLAYFVILNRDIAFTSSITRHREHHVERLRIKQFLSHNVVEGVRLIYHRPAMERQAEAIFQNIMMMSYKKRPGVLTPLPSTSRKLTSSHSLEITGDVKIKPRRVTRQQHRMLGFVKLDTKFSKSIVVYKLLARSSDDPMWVSVNTAKIASKRIHERQQISLAVKFNNPSRAKVLEVERQEARPHHRKEEAVKLKLSYRYTSKLWYSGVERIAQEFRHDVKSVVEKVLYAASEKEMMKVIKQRLIANGKIETTVKTVYGIKTTAQKTSIEVTAVSRTKKIIIGIDELRGLAEREHMIKLDAGYSHQVYLWGELVNYRTEKSPIRVERLAKTRTVLSGKHLFTKQMSLYHSIRWKGRDIRLWKFCGIRSRILTDASGNSVQVAIWAIGKIIIKKTDAHRIEALTLYVRLTKADHGLVMKHSRKASTDTKFTAQLRVIKISSTVQHETELSITTSMKDYSYQTTAKTRAQGIRVGVSKLNERIAKKMTIELRTRSKANQSHVVKLTEILKSGPGPKSFTERHLKSAQHDVSFEVTYKDFSIKTTVTQTRELLTNQKEEVEVRKAEKWKESTVRHRDNWVCYTAYHTTTRQEEVSERRELSYEGSAFFYTIEETEMLYHYNDLPYFLERQKKPKGHEYYFMMKEQRLIQFSYDLSIEHQCESRAYLIVNVKEIEFHIFNGLGATEKPRYNMKIVVVRKSRTELRRHLKISDAQISAIGFKANFITRKLVSDFKTLKRKVKSFGWLQVTQRKPRVVKALGVAPRVYQEGNAAIKRIPLVEFLQKSTETTSHTVSKTARLTTTQMTSGYYQSNAITARTIDFIVQRINHQIVLLKIWNLSQLSVTTSAKDSTLKVMVVTSSVIGGPDKNTGYGQMKKVDIFEFPVEAKTTKRHRIAIKSRGLWSSNQIAITSLKWMFEVKEDRIVKQTAVLRSAVKRRKAFARHYFVAITSKDRKFAKVWWIKQLSVVKEDKLSSVIKTLKVKTRRVKTSEHQTADPIRLKITVGYAQSSVKTEQHSLRKKDSMMKKFSVRPRVSPLIRTSDKVVASMVVIKIMKHDIHPLVGNLKLTGIEVKLFTDKQAQMKIVQRGDPILTSDEKPALKYRIIIEVIRKMFKIQYGKNVLATRKRLSQAAIPRPRISRYHINLWSSFSVRTSAKDDHVKVQTTYRWTTTENKQMARQLVLQKRVLQLKTAIKIETPELFINAPVVISSVQRYNYGQSSITFFRREEFGLLAKVSRPYLIGEVEPRMKIPYVVTEVILKVLGPGKFEDTSTSTVLQIRGKTKVKRVIRRQVVIVKSSRTSYKFRPNAVLTSMIGLYRGYDVSFATEILQQGTAFYAPIKIAQNLGTKLRTEITIGIYHEVTPQVKRSSYYDIRTFEVNGMVKTKQWMWPTLITRIKEETSHFMKVLATVVSKRERETNARIFRETVIQLEFGVKKHDPRIKKISTAESDSFVVGTVAKDSSYTIAGYVTSLVLYETSAKTSGKPNGVILKIDTGFSIEEGHEAKYSYESGQSIGSLISVRNIHRIQALSSKTENISRTHSRLENVLSIDMGRFENFGRVENSEIGLHQKFISTKLRPIPYALSLSKAYERTCPSLTQGSSTQLFGYAIRMLKPHKRRPTFTNDRSELLSRNKPDVKSSGYLNLQSEVTQELYAVRKVTYRFEETRSLEYSRDMVEANNLAVKEGYTNFGVYIEETFDNLEQRPRPLTTVERIKIVVFGLSGPTIRPILEFEGQWFHRITKYQFAGQRFVMTDYSVQEPDGSTVVSIDVVRIGVFGSHEVEYIGQEKTTISVIIEPSIAQTPRTPKKITSVAKNKRVFVVRQRASFKTFYFDLNTDKRPREHVFKGVFSEQSNHLDYHLLQCRFYKDRLKIMKGKRQTLHQIEGLNTSQKRAWKIRCSKSELAKRNILSYSTMMKPDERMLLIIKAESFRSNSDTVSELVLNSPHWMVYTTTTHHHFIDRHQDLSKVLGYYYQSKSELPSAQYQILEQSRVTYVLDAKYRGKPSDSLYFKSYSELLSVEYSNLQDSKVRYVLDSNQETEDGEHQIKGSLYSQSNAELLSVDYSNLIDSKVKYVLDTKGAGKSSQSYSLNTKGKSGYSSSYSLDLGGKSQQSFESTFKAGYTLQHSGENKGSQSGYYSKSKSDLESVQYQKLQETQVNYILNTEESVKSSASYSLDYKESKGKSESYSLGHQSGKQMSESHSSKQSSDGTVSAQGGSYSLQLDRTHQTGEHSSKHDPAKGGKVTSAEQQGSYNLQLDGSSHQTGEHSFRHAGGEVEQRSLSDRKGAQKTGEYSVQHGHAKQSSSESFELKIDTEDREEEEYTFRSEGESTEERRNGASDEGNTTVIHYTKSSSDVAKQASAVGREERKVVGGERTRRTLSRREISGQGVERIVYTEESRGAAGIQETGDRVTGRNMMHIRYRKLAA